MARDDEGQVILLAGILLVLGFLVFSIQLDILPTLGQQVGREAENPLLEDFLMFRTNFEDASQDELRNAAGTVVCPDLLSYGHRMASYVRQLSQLEESRGHSFDTKNLTVAIGGAANALIVTLEYILTDGTSTAHDRFDYEFTCTGAVTGGAACTPADTCFIERPT